jgi:hypothetical protein
VAVRTNKFVEEKMYLFNMELALNGTAHTLTKKITDNTGGCALVQL